MTHFIHKLCNIFKRDCTIPENKTVSETDCEIDRYAQVKKNAHILFSDFIDHKITDQEFCNQFNAIIREINNLDIILDNGSILMTNDIPMDLVRIGAYHYDRWHCFVELKSRVEKNPDILENDAQKEWYQHILTQGIDEEFRRICGEYLNQTKNKDYNNIE